MMNYIQVMDALKISLRLIVPCSTRVTLRNTRAREDSLYYRLPEQLPYTPSFRLAQTENSEEETVDLSSDIKVFPNPFSNEFTVSYSLPDTVGQLKFEIFDLTGPPARL